jgi:hypothetical protein
MSGACACGLSFTFGPVDIGCGDSSMESKSFFKLRDHRTILDWEVDEPC